MIKQYLLARLKEPSTWRGIVSVLTACGIALNPTQIEAIITVGLMIGGLIGVLTKDSATIGRVASDDVTDTDTKRG
jgi:hypothetical protein